MPQLTTTLPSLISFDLYSYFGHVPVVLKVKHDNLVYMENNRIPLWFRHSENTHAIAADIMRNSPVSRSQLARKHKLSQGTLSKITGELLYDGIIEESDAAASPGSAEMRTGDAGRGEAADRTADSGKIPDLYRRQYTHLRMHNGSDRCNVLCNL